MLIIKKASYIPSNQLKYLFLSSNCVFGPCNISRNPFIYAASVLYAGSFGSFVVSTYATVVTNLICKRSLCIFYNVSHGNCSKGSSLDSGELGPPPYPSNKYLQEDSFNCFQSTI